MECSKYVNVVRYDDLSCSSEFADFHDHTLTIIQKPESAGGIYDQDVSVMMLCEYSIQHENSSVTIQWIFRGQIIDTQFLDTVSLRTSTFSEGCYSCHVCLNSTTILSASIYINVRCKYFNCAFHHFVFHACICFWEICSCA